MILKPSCGWCKDQDAFEVNEQLVVLVSCFKKICELIYHSPILFHIKEYDKKSQGKFENFYTRSFIPKHVVSGRTISSE